MGSTRRGRIGLWSTWASPTKRPSLRWKASGAGGNWTGEKGTRRRGDYSYVPMLGGATELDVADGSSTCKRWRIRSGYRSRSATTLREPASGTRSNIDYSRLSV